MKTNMTIITGVLFFFLFSSIGTVWAFRCGSGLVTTGDTKTKVEMICGKPTSKEKKCKENWTNKKHDCSKKVDVWYYNCGENDFIYALTFENNTLTTENTEGRGKGNSNCRGK